MIGDELNWANTHSATQYSIKVYGKYWIPLWGILGSFPHFFPASGNRFSIEYVYLPWKSTANTHTHTHPHLPKNYPEIWDIEWLKCTHLNRDCPCTASDRKLAPLALATHNWISLGDPSTGNSAHVAPTYTHHTYIGLNVELGKWENQWMQTESEREKKVNNGNANKS